MKVPYSLLIVDDEEWIRQGLSIAVPWSKYGVSDVDTAANGQEAIAKIQKAPPNIIITDVVMPAMSGTQLTAWTRERYPDIEIIIISGYEQFEYARDALRLGAFDYLLKPVEEEKLVLVVQKAMKQMEGKRRTNEHARRYFDSLESLKQLFYMRLIDREAPPMGPDPRFQDCVAIPQQSGGTYCGAFWFLPESDADTVNDIYAILCNRLSKVMEPDFNYDLVCCNNGIAVMSYLGQSEMPLNRLLYAAFAPLKGIGLLCENYLCCIGKDAEGLEGLRSSFLEINNVVENSFKIMDNTVCGVNELRSRQQESLHFCKPILQQFLEVCRETCVDETVRNCPKLIDALLTAVPHIGKAELGVILFQTMLDCVKIFEESGRIGETITRDNVVLTWVFHFDCLEDVKAGLTNFFLYMKDSETLKNETVQKKVIRDALDYIHTNYKQDLSLEEISNYLHLSKSYFSQLFGRETSSTFSKYLTYYRIERAKELIKNSNLRIYQISQAVGYPDAKYFLKLFKRSTGVSPQIYREKS